MVDRVLVTGGTGKTGSLVARQLAARGVEARVATRNVTTPDQVHFEWGNTASFSAALDGVDAIYLVAPTDRTDHLPVMRPLLEQAVNQGVSQLVLLSASSLPEGAPMMGEVHAWLRANAARWTVLRPSWFICPRSSTKDASTQRRRMGGHRSSTQPISRRSPSKP